MLTQINSTGYACSAMRVVLGAWRYARGAMRYLGAVMAYRGGRRATLQYTRYTRVYWFVYKYTIYTIYTILREIIQRVPGERPRPVDEYHSPGVYIVYMVCAPERIEQRAKRSALCTKHHKRCTMRTNHAT